MRFNIIGDSSTDTGKELDEILQLKKVPFNITVDDEEYIDDESINVKILMEKIAASPIVAKTSAPSPNSFLQNCEERTDGNFIITISSRLSGAYNSALAAKGMFMEKCKKGKLHIIDSLSASSGQTVIALKLREYESQGFDFETISEKIDNFVKNLQTKFYVENLDTLIKNGRMGKLKGRFAQFLHIKPILSSDGNGEICLKDKARSTKKALDKLVKLIGTDRGSSENDTLIIAHCFAEEKAEYIKEECEKMNRFKKIYTVKTAGLSSTYANVGGIICCY